MSPGDEAAAAVEHALHCFVMARLGGLRIFGARVGTSGYCRFHLFERPVWAAVDWASVVGVVKEHGCGWVPKGCVPWDHEAFEAGN